MKLQSPKRLTARKRQRVTYMFWAYLTFHMRRHPQEVRESTSWLYLLMWASLGGTRDEVITAAEGKAAP